MKHYLILGTFAVLAGCSGEPADNGSGDGNAQAPMPQTMSAPDDVAASPDPAPTASQKAGAAQIPAAFRGEWNRSLEDCGTEGSETRLRIEAGRILFYESAGTVLAVAGSQSQINVRARYEGEGETWESSRSFNLSPDGRTLTAEGMVRIRCP